MSYRKMEINGTTYEYVVGRSHVKVKGLGSQPHHVIGELVLPEADPPKYVVKPSHVRDWIVKQSNT